MSVAIMQPYFFPYIGYFQLIHAVDTFVFYDDVHFTKKSWINRNRILINQEPFLFTIPCRGASQNKLINQVALDWDQKSKSLFLKQLEMAYKKAPFFESFYPVISSFVSADNSQMISELAQSSVRLVCDFLELDRSFLTSSEHFDSSRDKRKEQRLQHICHQLSDTDYVNAIGGREIYDPSDFDRAGISLKFLSSEALVYDQYKSSFVPWLSIIDVLMFNSQERTKDLLTKYQLI